MSEQPSQLALRLLSWLINMQKATRGINEIDASFHGLVSGSFMSHAMQLAKILQKITPTRPR